MKTTLHQLARFPHRCEADRDDDRDDRLATQREQARRRRMLTILFAVLLLSVAGVANAELPTVPEGTCEIIVHSTPLDGLTPLPAQAAGGAVALHHAQADARPVYAELFASLSNFDADADPDGWRAAVILRDRQDRPVVMRSHASFELMPRVAMADHQRFVDAGAGPIRWAMPLQFDDSGVASVKLPLRQSLRPMLGWSSALYPPSGMRSSNPASHLRGHRSALRSPTLVTSDLRNLIAMPGDGELRVRVSVPTEGVFEAVAVVPIRPSVLVDTRWPYR